MITDSILDLLLYQSSIAEKSRVALPPFISHNKGIYRQVVLSVSMLEPQMLLEGQLAS